MRVSKAEEPERYDIENLTRKEYMMIYQMFNRKDEVVERDKKSRNPIRGWGNLKSDFADFEEAKQTFKEIRDKIMAKYPY